MKRHTRLATVALAGLIGAGSLAATLSVASPALADDHRGNYQSRDQHWDARDRGHVVVRHDERRYEPSFRREWRPAPVYNYGYVAPVYQYPDYNYVPPSSGFVHVNLPGFSASARF